MTSMLNRVAGHVFAVVLGVLLVASGGVASAQQADGTASGDRLRAGGFAQPNVGDRHILEPFDDSDQSIRVYGAAQNAGTDDRDQHVYLYEPPLRFRVAADGTIVVRRNDADPRKVIFYLEGMNQDLEKRIQELLDADGIKVLARNVRPLQYTFMMLSDDSGQWRSRHPEDNESLPAPQNWIPFEVDFTGHEDGAKRADEFVNRLRTQEVEFDVILGYGGREIVRNTVELTTRRLLETSFHADLTGNGDFKYVTRNQIRDALAAARTEIQQRVYIEDPDATVPQLDWPERTWDRMTVVWDDFLSRHQAETSKYGFNGDDLTPDKFTRFEEHLKSELEDETKDYIDIQAEMTATAGFMGIGGNTGVDTQVKKEEFERRKQINENGVEWEGEVFRPRSIDLFAMDASALENEDRIGSYVITARPGTERFSFTISSRQGQPGRVAYVPSGAVVAFDREDGCPPGWSEYRDADGRFIVGTGRHTVHDAYENAVAELEFGEEGGERTHRLSADEVSDHEHEIWIRDMLGPGEAAPLNVGRGINDFNPRHELRLVAGTFGSSWGSSLYASDTGRSQAHNNMPPYIALRFCRLN